MSILGMDPNQEPEEEDKPFVLEEGEAIYIRGILEALYKPEDAEASMNAWKCLQDASGIGFGWASEDHDSLKDLLARIEKFHEEGGW